MKAYFFVIVKQDLISKKIIFSLSFLLSYLTLRGEDGFKPCFLPFFSFSQSRKDGQKETLPSLLDWLFGAGQVNRMHSLQGELWLSRSLTRRSYAQALGTLEQNPSLSQRSEPRANIPAQPLAQHQRPAFLRGCSALWELQAPEPLLGELSNDFTAG